MDQVSESIFKRLKVGYHADCSIASQIAEQIRWLIVTNEVTPGVKLPSARSLAGHLNINFHTVRAAYRLLEDNNLIATRQGLGSTVIEYSPAAIVSGNTMPTHTVGIIVPDMQNPFYPSFLHGASRIAVDHNVLAITCDTRGKIPMGKAFFEMLITKRVDGVLVCPWGLHPGEDDMFHGGDFYDFPIPLVFVDRPHVQGYSVLLDARGAGYKATRHLVEHGHHSIAILTGNLKIDTLRQCYEGYLSALADSGLAFDERLVVEVQEFSYQDGYLAAKQLIQNKLLPSAIFAAGDILAIGAMKALREHGYSVPTDVAITGYNDIDVSNFVSPSITSVTIPVRQMGEESARMLLKRINQQPVSRSAVVMQTELVIRESCGCPPNSQHPISTS